MKVAIITAYYREPVETLRRCHESVLGQSHSCDHFMVADGYPQPDVSGWDVQHLTLARAHSDYGNTPRAIGGMSALNQGYDAIAYLDADNWYAPDHVETLVQTCAETGSAVAFASRQIVLSTGEHCDYEDDDVLAKKHVDTNCFFITAKAAFLLPLWGMMDPAISAGGDRIMLGIVRRRRIQHAWTGKKTIYYESRWPLHFKKMGKSPPPDAHRVDWQKVRSSYSRERNFERLGFYLTDETSKRSA